MVKWLDKVKQWLYNRSMIDLSPKTLKTAREERDDEIRQLYWGSRNFPRSDRWTVDKLAEKYGISKQRVSQIINAEPPPGNEDGE